MKSIKPLSPKVSAISAGAVLVLALAGAGLAVIHGGARSPKSGSATVPPSLTAGFPSGAGNPGIFTERCAYSHEAPDDPIMMPGGTGMSMHHDFFGNTATDASSTATSLLGGKTTCATSADSSGYWIPVLYQNGAAVTPRSSLIYWRRPRVEQDAIQTVPAGLQIVAGNAASPTPLGVDRVAWSCAGEPKSAASARATASPHSCTTGGRLKETLLFPSCWDGHTLSAIDHTNMAYLGAGTAGCPSSHPVQIPQIVFHVVYPTSSADGIRLSLTPTTTASSTSAHADFLNGWAKSVLDTDVRACLATSTRCGGVQGPTATPEGPSLRQQAKLSRAAHKGRTPSS